MTSTATQMPLLASVLVAPTTPTVTIALLPDGFVNVTTAGRTLGFRCMVAMFRRLHAVLGPNGPSKLEFKKRLLLILNVVLVFAVDPRFTQPAGVFFHVDSKSAYFAPTP